MEKPQNLGELLFEQIPDIKFNMSFEEYAKKKVDIYNNTVGNLGYYDCDICKNKGTIMRLNDELSEVISPCDCMKKRITMENLFNSGLAQTAKKCTFQTFTTENEWQKSIKSQMMNYAKDHSKKWLYISGQSGCGKTHLCTAVCCHLISQGRIVKYKIWRNLFHELQSQQFNFEKYKDSIAELRNVDVLYIDDFLKSVDQSKISSEANFAFEIINERYNADKQTIISSELLLEQLTKLDSATAGRIVEKSGNFLIQIKPDNSKNYRMR